MIGMKSVKDSLLAWPLTIVNRLGIMLSYICIWPEGDYSFNVR